jgi:PiT family inorganic phosphate transporter
VICGSILQKGVGVAVEVVEVVVLVAVALATSLVSGSNDGATLVSLNTRTTTVSPRFAIVVLSIFVGLGPFLVGTAVATTLARGLVAFESSGGSLAFLVAVLSALVIVFALSHRGLPTSVTLALTGTIVGAGIGFSLPVHWVVVGAVLVSGLVAPGAAAVAGFAVASAEHRLRPPALPMRARRQVERLGFLIEALAYSSNDAEKLVAIMAVATGSTTGVLKASPFGQFAIALCFAPGILLSVHQVASRVAERMVRVRSDTAIGVTFCASGIVLVFSWLGYPISSTQAATAALIGTGARVSPRQVQWSDAAAIGLAWVVTLPISIGLAAAVGAAVRAVR